MVEETCEGCGKTYDLEEKLEHFEEHVNSQRTVNYEVENRRNI